jgi:hypothetical protein
MKRRVSLHGMAGALLALGALGLAACGPYQVRGRVTHGPAGQVMVVPPDHQDLQRPRGIPQAMVKLTLEPNSLSPEPLGADVTDEQGHFAVEVEHAGAELLDYELGVLVRAEGYSTLWQTLPTPGRDERLLVVMEPGQNEPRQESTLEDTLEHAW